MTNRKNVSSYSCRSGLLCFHHRIHRWMGFWHCILSPVSRRRFKILLDGMTIWYFLIEMTPIFSIFFIFITIGSTVRRKFVVPPLIFFKEQTEQRFITYICRLLIQVRCNPLQMSIASGNRLPSGPCTCLVFASCYIKIF